MERKAGGDIDDEDLFRPNVARALEFESEYARAFEAAKTGRTMTAEEGIDVEDTRFLYWKYSSSSSRSRSL